MLVEDHLGKVTHPSNYAINNEGLEVNTDSLTDSGGELLSHAKKFEQNLMNIDKNITRITADWDATKDAEAATLLEKYNGLKAQMEELRDVMYAIAKAIVRASQIYVEGQQSNRGKINSMFDSVDLPQ